ncbi:hypothetical protein [Clostridium sp. C2-6-12]|uniref:hypothetical protein n=1 Tax=Clostridium sp. C2-6-12 TaxID=2698832 RepID=UPI00136AF8B5|nr:hypothetical protein [Clostridium sp. C2-6-12]
MKRDKISDKLKFLKKAMSITNEKFAEIYEEKFPGEEDKSIQRTFERYLSGKYDNYNGKDKRINRTLEKFSETLGISLEQLKHNIFFTTEVGVRMKLEKVNKISPNSELLQFDDGIDEMNEENERNDCIKSILEKYNNMAILDCYKILKFYDDYEKISEDAWNLICSYALLNEDGKTEIRNSIFSMNIQNVVRLDIKCFNKNDSQLLSELYEKNNFADDIEIYRSLSEQLKIKLNVARGIYLDQLNLEIPYLPTLDLFDWQLVEYYYSLNYQEREMILNKCDILIEDPKYYTVYNIN